MSVDVGVEVLHVKLDLVEKSLCTEAEDTIVDWLREMFLPSVALIERFNWYFHYRYLSKLFLVIAMFGCVSTGSGSIFRAKD